MEFNDDFRQLLLENMKNAYFQGQFDILYTLWRSAYEGLEKMYPDVKTRLAKVDESLDKLGPEEILVGQLFIAATCLANIKGIDVREAERILAQTRADDMRVELKREIEEIEDGN